MRVSARPILYLLFLTILFAVFGFLVWKFLTTILFAVVGWKALRILTARTGLRPRPRTGKRSGIPAWIDAASLAWIAAHFGPPTKKEPVASGVVPRYRLPRNSQAGPDDPRWTDDPDWPYSPR